MTTIYPGKMAAEIEGEFVVLLIGARLHHPWMIHKWVPVAIAMRKMLRELEAHPESGFLGHESWGIFRPVLIQYWRSFDHLESYARSRDHHHWPAWVEYNRKMQGNKAMGIWHETYRIAPGMHEGIYTNMPAFGLARVTKVVPVGSRGETARARLGGENSPAPDYDSEHQLEGASH